MICRKCGGRGIISSNSSSSGIKRCDSCNGTGQELLFVNILAHNSGVTRATEIRRVTDAELTSFLDRLIFDEKLHKQIYKSPLNTLSKEERLRLLLDYLQEESNERF